MKATTFLTIGLCAALGSGALSARTWTSADGAKTFVGDFKSYDDAAAQVTVTMSNGRTMNFALDKLSDDDRTWVKTAQQEAAAEAAAEAAGGEIADQKIGGKLASSGTLKKLQDGKFADYELTTAPEYYLLYFSASW
jgi:hypothetical protein